MDFITLAKQRYSCRQYKQQAVEEEKLNLVLEAGRVAPSAVNYQPWIFIVVKDENKALLQSCYHRDWFNSAPTYIVLCIDHRLSWKRYDNKDHGDIDIAIAADHMTLAATSQGLATCWVCNFSKEKVIEALDLGVDYEPVVILPLGYPKDGPNVERHAEKRKSLEEIVFYEKYREKR